jgi:sterol desaturase/sphingolipid hydroxylase (fatty acid hydroxylase superfamily)
MPWRIIGSTVFYLSFLLGGCASCVALTHASVPPAVAIGLVTLVGIGVMFLGQRLWPYCQAWRAWKSEVIIDALHGLFSTVGVSALYQATVVAVVFWAADALSRALGGSFWPAEASWWLQLPLALLVADFGAYWFHRLAHQAPVVWRIHALHHSSEQLYVLSSTRNHPLNVIATVTVSTLPLVLLGAHGEVLLLTSLFTALNGLLQHANMDLRLGPLNWVLSGPELHRLHHSLDFDESNTNFGSNLIVWDVLFGTRYLPEGRTIQSIGLAGLVITRNYWAQLSLPFSWRKWVSKVEAK